MEGNMKKLSIIVFLSITLFYSLTVGNSQQLDIEAYQDIQEIDQRIQELRQDQVMHRSRALRFTDKANRWQFQSNLSLEAKRAYQMAEEEKIKIAEAELEIKLLEQRKLKLIKGKS